MVVLVVILRDMRRRIFNYSVVVYIALSPLIAFSLSVPPHNLIIFLAMAVAAASALATSREESRRWRLACIIGLAFAVVGGILEVIAGLVR